PCTYDPTTRTITWTLGTVAAHTGSVDLTFTTTLDSSFPAGPNDVQNTGVTHAPDDSTTNTNTTIVTVTTAPVIAQDKSVRVLPDGTFGYTADANPGDSLEYQITWTNSGDAPAVGYTVTDVVQAGQTYNDDCGGAPCAYDPDTRTITWTLGPVAANGGSVTLTFTTTLDSVFPPGESHVQNTAITHAPGGGETPTDTTDVKITVVPQEPSLHLAKTANGTSFGTGDQITYTLSYWNDGGTAAINAIIKEPLPAGTTFSDCTGGCNSSGDPITWTIASVPAGSTETDPAGSVTLTVTVSATAGCTICNIATIESSNQSGNPVPSNGGVPLCVDVTGPAPTAAAGAYGFHVDAPIAGGLNDTINGLSPTTADDDPDAPENDNNTLLTVPGDPLVNAKVVEVGQESNLNSGSHAFAFAKTAQVKVLSHQDEADAEPDWLVTADAVEVFNTSDASGTSASSSSTTTDGTSVLLNVTVEGENIGTVSEPTTIVVDTPLGKATISLLEKIATGAGGGVPQPEGQTFSSGIAENGIHVTVEDPAGRIVHEVIVAHAETSASAPSTLGCGATAPHVSGEGYSLGVEVDDALLDDDSSNFDNPQHVLVDGRVGEVLLPSTGGDVKSTLAHVGPISLDGDNTLAESGTAENHTTGALDPLHADTTSEIESLQLLDNNSAADAEEFLLTADAVKSESHSFMDGNTATSEGSTTLVDVRLNGTEICGALGLQDPGVNGAPMCSPKPNTVLLGIPDAVVVLNEQLAGSGDGASSLTVNAIHIYVLGGDNPFGLPAAADVIVSSSHSDIAVAGAEGITESRNPAGPTVICFPLHGDCPVEDPAAQSNATASGVPAPAAAPAPAPAAATAPLAPSAPVKAPAASAPVAPAAPAPAAPAPAAPTTTTQPAQEGFISDNTLSGLVGV
ncbi:MAG: DUF11 domain-containing protein, partial [Actinobacteria bacterium]|nr:DUF11 domain-containing protein [Actinomycetota bacterium]